MDNLLQCPRSNHPCHKLSQDYRKRLLDEDEGAVRISCSCGVSGSWEPKKHLAARSWNDLPRNPTANAATKNSVCFLDNEQLNQAINDSFSTIMRCVPNSPEQTRIREHWLALLAERECRCFHKQSKK